MQEINQIIVNTGRRITGNFQSNPEVFITCMVKFDSIRNTMFTVYCNLISLKLVEPLEKLDQETKVKIWNQTKEFTKGMELNTETMVKLSKALYALEYFLHEKQ